MFPLSMEQLQSNHNNEMDCGRNVPVFSHYGVFCCDVSVMNAPIVCIKNYVSDHYRNIIFLHDNIGDCFLIEKDTVIWTLHF